MKRFTLGCLALVASASLQAESLQIKAGETYTLDADRTEWVLDTLVLEDNATLIIPAASGQVQLDAARAVIGHGASILARGRSGAGGTDAAPASGQADKCTEGVTGSHGSHGQAGGDGVALNLTLRIARLDSLVIDTGGGAGGAGGAGGSGQDGGDFDNCNAPGGGEGGRGGDGGDGGAGGHVRVFYTLLPESGLEGSIAGRIKVSAQGGQAAVGGAGGKGGAGSQGKFITMKTLSGNKKWIAGGKAGADGITGKAGRDGAKGQILIQQDLRSRMDELVQQQSAQVEAISSQLAGQADARQGVQTLSQEVTALKVAVATLASRDMVQKQGVELDARTAKLDQTLNAVLSRLEQLERKLEELDAKISATPAVP